MTSFNLGQLSRTQILIGSAVIVVLYVSFIWGLSTNPPGFYMDESCEAYNGYLVAKTGTTADGQTIPLFFQCYTERFTQWMSPELMYMFAGMYSFIPPSTLSAHILSATIVFVAMSMLGLLASRLSGRPLIGIIVGGTAMATPWFFEISRLVQETSPLAFSVVLFLFILYIAYSRGEWKLQDVLLLGLALGLITYAYAAGRILGPALAFGLLIFAFNKRALLGVISTWAVYLLTLIPFIYVYLTKRGAITQRFNEVTYITGDKSWWEIISHFISVFFQDLNPGFLLFWGDPVGRHHVPVMGEIFAATFILVIIGLILVLLRHRSDPWWRFVLYGAVISILPGAITNDRYHSLRLLAFPFFLMMLTVPALSWLIGEVKQRPSTRVRGFWGGWTPGRISLSVLLVLTLAQALFFQVNFRNLAPQRYAAFNADYPRVLDKALSESDRPIYLLDGSFGPGYIHALWYATIRGIDLSNFHHLSADETLPSNSLVLSTESKCSNCDVILQKDQYILYKTVPTVNDTDPQAGLYNPDLRLNPLVVVGSQGSEPGKFSKPRGIAGDSSGNFYVADAGNSRLEKFDSGGNFIASFGIAGADVGQMRAPDGVAVDEAGNIYVTDSANHKLLKLGSDGQFLNEWTATPLAFYGPRDMAFGPNKQLYIIDQGRNRIVRFDPQTESFFSWGDLGTAEGQFSEPNGITVGGDLVFVTEPKNHRIQVFDLDGQFVRQWLVEAWDNSLEQYPDVIFDDVLKRLYVTNSVNKDILVFDVEGNPKGRIKPMGSENLGNPSGICILELSRSRSLAVLDSGDSKVYLFDLGETKKHK